MVEPPLQAIAAIAFSSAVARDDVARALAAGAARPSRAARRRAATSALRGSVGRDASESPIGEIPSTSNAIAIVLAVNWPPHAPAPGEATASSSASSSSVMRARGVRADRLEHVLDRHRLAVEVARA